LRQRRSVSLGLKDKFRFLCSRDFIDRYTRG